MKLNAGALQTKRLVLKYSGSVLVVELYKIYHPKL
jgi:hypothetical protein